MKLFSLFLLFAVVLFVHAEEEYQNRTTRFGSFPFKNIFSKGTDANKTETADTKTNDQKENVEQPTLSGEAPKREKGRLSGFGRDIIKATAEGISSAIKKTRSFIPSPKTGGLDSFFDKIPGTAQIGKVKREILNHAKSIYPGTKWCGGGNISKTEDDLGLFADTDVCCREHDMCPDNIDAGATKNGLHNNALFTRSHCDCDTKFYDCLLGNVKYSLPSAQLGITYFNILGPQCYKEDYPIKSCLKTVVTESNLTKCEEYELDKTLTPVWQWFDNKLFWGVPLISG